MFPVRFSPGFKNRLGTIPTQDSCCAFHNPNALCLIDEESTLPAVVDEPKNRVLIGRLDHFAAELSSGFLRLAFAEVGHVEF